MQLAKTINPRECDPEPIQPDFPLHTSGAVRFLLTLYAQYMRARYVSHFQFFNPYEFWINETTAQTPASSS
jgi:hypothetical protein